MVFKKPEVVRSIEKGGDEPEKSRTGDKRHSEETTKVSQEGITKKTTLPTTKIWSIQKGASKEIVEPVTKPNWTQSKPSTTAIQPITHSITPPATPSIRDH